jgi:hypothetical protein
MFFRLFITNARGFKTQTRGRLFSGTVILCFLGLLVSGCTGFRGNTIPQIHEGPARATLAAVPFYPQEAYECGPAALAMALSWSGLPTEPRTLVPEVYTPSLKGSLQTALVGAARRHGRIAYPISGMDDLVKEIAAGHPVIVLQNLGLSWYPKWHYAVAVGYDLSKNLVELHSGKTPGEQLSLQTFENTWARAEHWGLLVLRPGDLPATAKEDRYVQAVLGLEKAGRWHAAINGYETALSRWPESLAARMGLGNSLYALGELSGAENVFREAVRLYPSSGAAYNNLAQVLWEQNRGTEALEAARRAVSLGGPMVAVYRETLREIEAGKH